MSKLSNTLRRWLGLPSEKREAGNAAAPSAPRLGGAYGLVPLAADAMTVATVYRCVRLLSEGVANLPMRFMRQRDGIFVEAEGSRLQYLLAVQPNPAVSAFDFWTQLVAQVLLEGNAYVVPVYNAATLEPDRLVLCSRGSVSHDIYADTYTVCDELTGIHGLYQEAEIIHVKGYSPDGKRGLGVIAHARLTLDTASAGDRETQNRFINGGNVRGIVSNDKSTVGFGEYQDKELEKTAESLDDRFQSGEHIVSLPGQVGFQQISLSSTDMQFLESRKFTVREICRFFGVHPSFVFDDTAGNYKSAEMANVAFLSNTLNPLLRKIENELLRKLVAPPLASKRKFEFDRRGLYACDLQSRVQYQAATIGAGIYTVNEWRRQENKPPVEGGDRPLVSANLRDLSQPAAPQQGDGQAAPAPVKDNDDNEEKQYQDGQE